MCPRFIMVHIIKFGINALIPNVWSTTNWSGVKSHIQGDCCTMTSMCPSCTLQIKAHNQLHIYTNKHRHYIALCKKEINIYIGTMDRITSSVSQKLFGANRKPISPKSHPASFMDLKMPARIPRVDHVERNGQIGNLPWTPWFPLVWSTCGVLGWFLAYPTDGKCTCFFSGGYKFLYVCELNIFIYLLWWSTQTPSDAQVIWNYYGGVWWCMEVRWSC